MVPAQVTHWVFGRVGPCLGEKGASGAEGKPIWSQFCTSRCTMSILLAWEDNSDPGGPESP
eukprot:3493948-Prymnesium_polylepis.1